MKFYFDVTETFVQTVAIEAKSREQARRRIEGAYNRKEFEIDRKHPDDIVFKDVQKEVKKSIREGFVAEEELETFNCNDVVWDDITESYVCPVCGEYVASRFDFKCIDYPLPKHCHECGAKLHY